MVKVEATGYAGRIAFVSWVLGKRFVDRGINVHKTAEAAANEIRDRLKTLTGGRPEVIGGWVEQVNSDGSAVSAVRPDIERL